MNPEDDIKTEPGFIITLSLSSVQRAALDEIKDLRAAQTGVRPTVRELVDEAFNKFLAQELHRRF